MATKPINLEKCRQEMIEQITKQISYIKIKKLMIFKHMEKIQTTSLIVEKKYTMFTYFRWAKIKILDYLLL